MSIHRTIAISLTSAVLILAGGLSAGAAELSMEDAKVVAAYPLTTDKMERKYAAAADMGRLSVTDPAFEHQMQSINQQPGLDAQIKAIGAVPKAVATIQAHGLAVRDYCLITLAIGYAMMPQMPAGLRQANAKPDPAQVAAPPEHVEFVLAHREEIQKLTAAVVQARQAAQH